MNMGFPIVYWTYDDLNALAQGQLTFSDFVRELRENRVAVRETDVVIMGKPCRVLETTNMGIFAFVIPVPGSPVILITFYIHNFFDENTGINVAGEFYIGTPETELEPKLFCSWELVDTNADLKWVSPTPIRREISTVLPQVLIFSGGCILLFALGLFRIIKGVRR